MQDGDTLTLLVDNQRVRVRLAEIDAPEKGQPFGTRSRKSLSAMCAGKVAEVDSRERDKYGRIVGRVTCDGKDTSVEQVRAGMAWVYDYYTRDQSLYRLQDEARAERRGLWADKLPVPPWEWRRAVR